MDSLAAKAIANDAHLLKNAAQEDFKILYQPVFSTVARNFQSFEALTRWQHPQRGLVLPHDFIPLAEETEMIISIERWILGKACQDIYNWQKRGLGSAVPPISINISSKHFQQPNFLVKQIDWMLAKSYLKPEYVKLEIPEKSILNNFEAAISFCSKMSSFGIQIIIDNFTANKVILSFLEHVSIEAWKTDHLFMMNLEGNPKKIKQLHLIRDFSRKLNIRAIVKGVSSIEQFQQIEELDFKYVQGNFLGKPLDNKEISALLLDSAQANIQLESLPRLFSYLSALSILIQAGQKYLGTTIAIKYWQASRPNKKWLEKIEINHHEKIKLHTLENRPVNHQQEEDLRQWSSDFIQQCSQVILNFPALLSKENLSMDDKNLLRIKKPEKQKN